MSTRVDLGQREEHMHMLERRGNVVRTRLLSTLAALDARRHRAVAAGAATKRIVLEVVSVLAGGAVILAVTFYSIRRVRRRHAPPDVRARAFLARFRAPKPPSLLSEVIRKLVTTSVTIVAGEVTRRAAKNIINGRHPASGELALPPHRARP